MDRMQYREVETDAFAAGDIQVDVGINLAVIGQVNGNMPGAVKVRILQQVECEILGGLLLLLETQRTAMLSQVLAKFTA